MLSFLLVSIINLTGGGQTISASEILVGGVDPQSGTFSLTVRWVPDGSPVDERIKKAHQLGSELAKLGGGHTFPPEVETIEANNEGVTVRVTPKAVRGGPLPDVGTPLVRQIKIETNVLDRSADNTKADPVTVTVAKIIFAAAPSREQRDGTEEILLKMAKGNSIGKVSRVTAKTIVKDGTVEISYTCNY